METLELSILVGDAQELKLLLKEATREKRAALLKTKYGGRGDSGFPDSKELYGGTSPILHAAITGNAEILSLVLKETKDTVGLPQVIWGLPVQTSMHVCLVYASRAKAAHPVASVGLSSLSFLV